MHFCRFDGEDFLIKFKGKQIMFVGDSVSANQWQSFICMLHFAVPQTQILEQGSDPITNYTFQVSELSHHKPSFRIVAKKEKKKKKRKKLHFIKISSNYNICAGLWSFSDCFPFCIFG